MPRSSSGRSLTTPLSLYALVSTVGLLAMLPALLPGAGLAWDDIALIQDSLVVRSPDGWKQVWTTYFWGGRPDWAGDYYRPLVNLSYWIEVHLFGAAPLLQHWTNVVLHLACVALALRWSQRRVNLEGVPAATGTYWLGIATLVFAVHPSRAEPVAWISGRTDVMALAFSLGAIEVWALGLRLRWLLTPLLFIGGLLCKETAATVVAVWLADAYLLQPETEPRRRPSPAMWGVTAAVALATLMRLWLMPPSTRDAGSAQGVLAALGLYLRETLAPFPPSALIAPPIHRASGEQVFATAWVVAGAAAALAFLALAVLALRKPSLRPWLADTLWFLVPLLPALHFMTLPVVSHVALRFLYIPMLGISALLLRGALRWSERRTVSPRLRVAVAAAILLSYLPFTLTFAAAYRSDRNLWAYEMAIDPERSRVLYRWLSNHPESERERVDELTAHAAQLALEEGNQKMAARIAVDYGATLARAAPLDECYPDLIHALDLLATGQEAHFGPDGKVRVQLSDEGARWVREQHPPFAVLRAQLLLRCGALDQLLHSLRVSPDSLDVGLMRVRALTLNGQPSEAREVIATLRRRYPTEPRVERMAQALGRAEQWIERARKAEGVTAQLLVIQVHLALGDLAAAHAMLDAVEPEAHGEVAFHRARIELERLAGRPQGVRRALQEARAALPEAEALWQRASQRSPTQVRR